MGNMPFHLMQLLNDAWKPSGDFSTVPL